MTGKIFRHTVGYFSEKDVLEASDLFSEADCLSVACAERKQGWTMEILAEKSIPESELSAVLKQYSISEINVSELEDENWLQKCFENFKPIVLGNFYIYGPHLRGESIPFDKIPMEIAAATAFGTGEHPTTDRCLIACQTFFDERRHKSALDVGCGSCILSIALGKLGAKSVDACDICEEAVRVSRENTIINGVAHRVNVFQNYGCEFKFKKYDFIVSNILADQLISMAEDLVSSLSPRGVLVLSGFTSNDDSVLEKYLSLGLSLKFKYDYKGWTTLVLEKIDPLIF